MTIDRDRLSGLLTKEQERFTTAHPRSRALFERAQQSLLGGVPMNWMVRWAGSFPIFVQEASGAHFTDVDGHRYLDLCLGDTGAMTGHAPAASVAAIAAQARRGITFMLPTEDAIWVGEELARRFGLPYWQTTLTATDANRFAIRLARHVTAAEDPGLQLVLPRHRGRDVHHPEERRRRSAQRQSRTAGRSRRDDPGRRVQRRRRRSRRRWPTATSPACWPSRS